jgi:uncharacterized membrane protein YfcA
MEFSIELLTILFFTGLLAGIIDTIAGGGGLITIPALLSCGVPPAAALATNKLQAIFGTATASLYFIRKKVVDIKKIWLLILVAFIGSILGGWILIQIDATLLKSVIPVLLISIGTYFIFSKSVGEVEKHKKISYALFAFTLVFIISFYDGFFGPGTGSFFAIAFVYYLGYNLAKATAQAKVLNFATNAGSLLFFIFFGEIFWILGIIMGAGQIIGALVGARLVITKGQKLIRPVIIFISFAMSIKLLLS